MMQKLYFIKYQANGTDCPHFTGGRHFKDECYTGEHEWDFNAPNPFNAEIKSHYGLEIDVSSLDCDYSDNIYVSELFLKLLDECGVVYRAVPYEIILNTGEKPQKKYYVLLLAGRIFLLDKEKSIYVVAKDFYSHQPLHSKFDSREPVYERITKFIPKEIDVPDVFICAENNKLMCTERFKSLAEEKQLKGLSFVEMRY